MTKNITDSSILSAMSGQDTNDSATKKQSTKHTIPRSSKTGTLKGLRFGAIKTFRDSIYKQSINTIIKLGGTVVEYEPEPMSFDFWNHTYCRHESRSPLFEYLCVK
jgi:amidase